MARRHAGWGASLTWRCRALEAVGIDQETGQVEELGREHLDYSCILSQPVLSRLHKCHAVGQPVLMSQCCSNVQHRSILLRARKDTAVPVGLCTQEV